MDERVAGSSLETSFVAVLIAGAFNAELLISHQMRQDTHVIDMYMLSSCPLSVCGSYTSECH